ncbi:MAG: hypothetical protein ACREK6_19195 [Candidatus Rokuibacteriota bacterium]
MAIRLEIGGIMGAVLERLAELVNSDEALEVTIMEELGHFPMSENPDRFRRYILPVLDDIQGLEGS